VAGGAFGQRLLAPGDLNGDQAGDLVIGSPGAAGGEGEVIAVSGVDGTALWSGVLRPVDPASDARDTPSRLGTALSVFEDVTGCGAQPRAGDNCLATSPDGIPELLVSAPGADLSNVTAREIGRVYVVDGKSGAIVKRIQLDPAGDLPPGGKVEFGASVLMVPDSDSGGRPDIAAGAPGWDDTFNSNSNCEVSPGAEAGTCEQAGRLFVFSYEAALGTPGSLIKDIGNPLAQDDTSAPPGTEPERFGAALADIGDLGTDGQRDYVVTAPRYDHDTDVRDSGTAFMISGAASQVLGRMDSPAPQGGGRFGDITYHPPPIGNVGGSGGPDVYLAAPGHTGDVAGQGRAYLLDGDVGVPVPVLATLNDPAPVTGGGFGSAAAGLVSGALAVGAPFGARVGGVRIFDPPGSGTLALSICDPDGQPGAGFGASIAALGDSDGDGFDEIAIGAPGFDRAGAVDSGRVYILTSKGPAATGPGECPPAGGGATDVGGGDVGGDVAGDDFVEDETAVIARVLRRLVLSTNRKRVRKDATIRLRGKLTASANRSVCQRRQKIGLQRRKASGGRFQTFDVAITRASGKFTARAIAQRTYVYRARVSRTARCMGAVSKTTKVSVLRRSGSR
jgi:hypothetical protein